MTELEMKDDVETEEFTDELSDEALDREGVKLNRPFNMTYLCRAGN